MTADLPNLYRTVQEILNIPTWGRGMYELTDAIRKVVTASQIQTGLCHVYVHHNSSSLIVCENADPSIRRDVEALVNRLVPESGQHTAEQADDSLAHMRAALSPTSLTIPITEGRCSVGRWQAIYIWEHKRNAQQRTLTVTVMGAVRS